MNFITSKRIIRILIIMRKAIGYFEIYHKVEGYKLFCVLYDILNYSNEVQRIINHESVNVNEELISNFNDMHDKIKQNVDIIINAYKESYEPEIKDLIEEIIKGIEQLKQTIEASRRYKVILGIENIFSNLRNDEKNKNSNNKIKVVFFAQAPQIWPSTESVWKAFDNDSRCITQVVQLPFLHDSYIKHEIISKYLEEKNIEYRMYYEYDIAEDKPDFVLFQNPYESTRPIAFQFDTINKIVKRTVYIPYGIDIGGGKENIEWQFNLPVQKFSWKVIARSKRHKMMFEKYCDSHGRNVIGIGHPKFDGIYKILNEDIKAPDDWIKKINGRKVLLWNPHFSVDGGDAWSTFEKWVDVILQLFNANKDVFLLIRPHPLLFDRLILLKKMNEQQIEEFRNMIKESDNILLDETDDYKQSFFLSNGIMTDAGSFLLEYLPTKKPILYLPNDKGPGLYDDSLVDHYYIGRKREEIEDFIMMIYHGEDPLYDKRMDTLKEHLPDVDGCIGERIKEYLIDQFLQEENSLRG